MPNITFPLILLLIAVAFNYSSLFYNIRPIKYNTFPNPSPLKGHFTPNTILQETEHLNATFPLKGPETIIFNEQGDMFTFSYDGWIIRKTKNNEFKHWFYIGGRPLAGSFDSEGDLIICVVGIGLCKVNIKTKEMTILTKMAENKPIVFPNDLDIGSDGKIYFSDSSHIFPAISPEGEYKLLEPVFANGFEGTKTGRLLVYNPRTKRTRVLVKDLFFANGVSLSKNEDFVLVAETFEFQIRRFWLKGEHKGTSDIFAKSLPGYIDNINLASDGSFYVSIPTLPSNFMLEIRKYPFVRGLIAKFPFSMFPKTKNYGLLLKISENGKDIHSFHDPTGKFSKYIASVTEYGEFLYFGSFSNNYIGKMDKVLFDTPKLMT